MVMAGSSLFRLSLTEKHRPRTWAEVVGQEKIITRLRGMLARTGLAGRAYFLAGGSGQGKTTIARLISAEVADEFMIREVDASALTVPTFRVRFANLAKKPRPTQNAETKLSASAANSWRTWLAAKPQAP
jgi:replication-associated recombination protein RarA